MVSTWAEGGEQTMKRLPTGFTLIELLIVVAIIFWVLFSSFITQAM